MAYPVTPIRRPAVLEGQENGRLALSILHTTPGLDDGPLVTLVEPAARSWRALTAAALRDGHVLKASGPADSFRPYSTQERIFRERYTTTELRGRPTKRWQGKTWWQRPGTAVAAVPGTSNHGWALAVDVGEERDQDPTAESLDRETLDWLLEYVGAFGWSWELQSEPWHLHYFAGDAIPAAVLEHENDHQEDDMSSPTIFIATWATRIHLVDLERRRADWLLSMTAVRGLEKLYPNIGAVDEGTMVNLLAKPG